MNEEEKFDELLNSKLSERDFPFDELNWDEAERLIIQQERKRKFTRFVLIFSSGLAAGMLIMLPFISNIHSTLPTTISINPSANQSTIAQNNILPSTNQTKKNTNTTSSKEDKTALPVKSTLAKNDIKRDIGDKSLDIPSITRTPKEHHSVLVADVNKPNYYKKVSANTSLIVSANKISEQPEVRSPVESNKNETKPMTSPLPPITNPATEKIQPATNTNATDKSTIASTNTSVTNTQQVFGGSPMKNLTIHNDATKNKNDTSNNILPPLNPDNPASSGPPSTNILSVYAGGNYSFGWINDGIATGYREGRGLTPWAGFDFTHYFAGDVSASLGIGYSELTGLNTTYTSTIINYDFGVNASTTNVTPQTVYYLAFPFKLQYNLDSKDLFSIGINYLWMLTTSSTLTTYAQTYSLENNSVTPTSNPGTSSKQNGYTQGFSNSDLQLSLSFTRMFTKRFGVSIEWYRDFGNIENNTIPGLDQNAKNMGLRLVLSYQLMK